MVPCKSHSALPRSNQDGGGIFSLPDWSAPPPGVSDDLRVLHHRWTEWLQLRLSSGLLPILLAYGELLSTCRALTLNRHKHVRTRNVTVDARGDTAHQSRPERCVLVGDQASERLERCKAIRLKFRNFPGDGSDARLCNPLCSEGPKLGHLRVGEERVLTRTLYIVHVAAV